MASIFPFSHRLRESSPAIRVIADLKESWLDILAVQISICIVNHNSKRYQHLGIAWHAWLSFHGTRPGTRRVEWSPLTGGNRQFGAAAHHYHQEYEPRHPPVAKSIALDEALTREPTERADREVHGETFAGCKCGYVGNSWSVGGGKGPRQ